MGITMRDGAGLRGTEEARTVRMSTRLLPVAAVALGAMLVATVPVLSAQAPSGGSQGHHRTPAGWKFAWPKGGDPTRGRQVFVRLQCYSCHDVKGEDFPAPSQSGKAGPELSEMGALHESEYFAEAIINPGAVIEKGRGYEASDGSSTMPSYNDSVTVQEVVDLVAFLKTLRPPAAHDGHQHH
jgi:sulfur-oxidizing protein SoxX